jgi:hypothetical protein
LLSVTSARSGDGKTLDVLLGYSALQTSCFVPFMCLQYAQQSKRRNMPPKKPKRALKPDGTATCDQRDVPHHIGSLSAMQEAFLHRLESNLVMSLANTTAGVAESTTTTDVSAALKVSSSNASLEAIARLVASAASWLSLMQRCAAVHHAGSSEPSPPTIDRSEDTNDSASTMRCIPCTSEFIVNPLAHYPGVPSALSKLSSKTRIFGRGNLLRELSLLPKDAQDDLLKRLFIAATSTTQTDQDPLDASHIGSSESDDTSSNSTDSSGLALSLESSAQGSSAGGDDHPLGKELSPLGLSIGDEDEGDLDLREGGTGHEDDDGADESGGDFLMLPSSPQHTQQQQQQVAETTHEGASATGSRKRPRGDSVMFTFDDDDAYGDAIESRRSIAAPHDGSFDHGTQEVSSAVGAAAQTPIHGSNAPSQQDVRVSPEVFLSVLTQWLTSTPIASHILVNRQRQGLAKGRHSDKEHDDHERLQSLVFETYYALMLFSMLESQRQAEYYSAPRYHARGRGGLRRRARVGGVHFDETVITNELQFNDAARLVTIKMIDTALGVGRKCGSVIPALGFPMGGSARGIGHAVDKHIVVGVLAAVLDSTTHKGAADGKSERCPINVTTHHAVETPQLRRHQTSKKSAKKSRNREQLRRRQRKARKNEEIIIFSDEESDEEDIYDDEDDEDYIDEEDDVNEDSDSSFDGGVSAKSNHKAQHQPSRRPSGAAVIPTLRTHTFRMLNPVVTLLLHDGEDDDAEHHSFLHEGLVLYDGVDHFAATGEMTFHLTGSAGRL